VRKDLLFIRTASYVIVALLASALTLFASRFLPGNSKLDKLEHLITSCFAGEADEEAMEDAAAAAMVKATGDRWSYYIPASGYDAHMERMENAYTGIGVTIKELEEDGGFLIMALTEGGSAGEAGIMIGDVLIMVGDQDVRGMTTDEVRSLITGKEGTKVVITVLRQGEHTSMAVERRKIETPVATYEMLDGHIGLVKIENFDERCAEETIEAIEALRKAGAKKLIFDVRNNPGGYAHEMVKVLDYLLPEGEVFRTVDYRGKEIIDTSDAACLDIPMAVLVNGSSYSGAEFFAAAMQEYEAAVIVGEKTVGKGYFQSTYRFEDGSAVGLSIGRYYTPSGKNLEGVGITPDVIVQVDEETDSGIYYGTVSHEDDPQLQAAIKALTK